MWTHLLHRETSVDVHANDFSCINSPLDILKKKRTTSISAHRTVGGSKLYHADGSKTGKSSERFLHRKQSEGAARCCC